MSENIFEKVLDNVDIVDVVSQFVSLNPKGKNFFGLCPFHDDHDASLSVTRDYGDHGIWQCWVCKVKGNAINFIQQYKKLSYLDATKYLAKENHIDVSEFKTSASDKYDKYYEIMKISSKFYSFIMSNDNFSKEARTYLHNRGIDDKTIKEFEIGLSSDDKSALTENLLKKKYVLPDIEINGLANNGADVFTDRIIVPIKDEQGRVVAFGGRIYKESSSGQNKYQNSTETPIFKKGKILFNLDKAVNELKNEKYLILNEGYMDVIQAYSKGIKNSIALMGTAITDDQADLIAKYTKNVAICLDGDKAGIKGVKTVIEKFEKRSINYSVTILKDGLDPDEYLRKYSKDEYLKEIKENRLDKVGYLYELTKLDYPEINSFNMESFEKAMFNNIVNEKREIIVERYLKRIASEINVSYESILQDYKTFNRPKLNRNNSDIEEIYEKPDDTFKIESRRNKCEKMLIDYSLEAFKYFKEIEIKMDSRVFMKNEFYKTLFIEIGDIYDTRPNISKNELIKKLQERDVYKDFDHDNKIEFSLKDLKGSLLKSLDIDSLKEDIEYYTKKIKDPSLDKDKKKYYIIKIVNLKKELQTLR